MFLFLPLSHSLSSSIPPSPIFSLPSFIHTRTHPGGLIVFHLKGPILDQSISSFTHTYRSVIPPVPTIWCMHAGALYMWGKGALYCTCVVLEMFMNISLWGLIVVFLLCTCVRELHEAFYRSFAKVCNNGHALYNDTHLHSYTLTSSHSLISFTCTHLHVLSHSPGCDDVHW